MAEPSPRGVFDDTLPTWRFLIEVDGVEIGRFDEVTGLSVDVAVVEVEEGGENGFVHRLPGRLTWPNLVLKRGVTKDDGLFAWLDESSGAGFAKNGHALTRKTAAVTLLGNDGARLRSWDLADAFAVRWSGPTFSADDTSGALEELEIAHHGFRPRTV